MNMQTQFHDAKTAFIAGINGFSTVAGELVTTLATDTSAMRDILLDVANTDYPVDQCNKKSDTFSPVTVTAWNSMRKALARAGDAVPDTIGGRVSFTFSTATDNGEKVRTVSVEYFTPDQLQTITDRAKQDTAIAAERAEVDAEQAEQAERQQKLALTPLDVFNKLATYAAGQFPDHDIREIVAAGLAQFAEQDNKAEQGKRKTA